MNAFSYTRADGVAAAVRAERAHGGRHVVGTAVGEGVHRGTSPAPRGSACSMAATMFG